MQLQWHSISKQEFIKDYWQKQPVVLKQALPNFVDPIEPEQLAGLAMEEFVDSRIVKCSADKWQLEQGPFEDFSQLGEQDWSLLVQGVDNYSESVQELLSIIDFIPKWRIDDVMVSFSMPGGSVGPHLDQYDVFIVQGHGARRWQAGAVDKALIQQETCANLLQLEAFDAVIDEVLEPGDILYIPPFSPHCGNTLEPALNYSIGFRAPSGQELLSAFADYAIDNELGMTRFEDEGLDTKDAHFSPSARETQRLKQQLKALVDEPGVFERFLNQKLTLATRELDLVAPVTRATTDNIEQLMEAYGEVKKVLGLKSTMLQVEGKTYFMCAGEEFRLEEIQIDFASQLNSRSALTKNNTKSSLKLLANRQLLATLINQGHWYFDE